MKKIIFIVLLVTLSLSLTSCWDYKETEKIGLVLGFGVDYDEETDEYITAVEIYHYANEKAGSHLIINKSKSILEGVRKVIEVNGEVGYWAHNQIFVIGEEYARKKGVIQFLDILNRDFNIRGDTHIVVAKDCTAKEVMENLTHYEPMISLNLEEMLQYQERIGKFNVLDVNKFIEILSTKGMEPILPLIYLENNKNNNKVIRIGGSAIFSKDKMIGKLTEDETLYYLFIENKINNQPIINYYDYGNDTIKLTYQIKNNNSVLTPNFTGNELKMDLDIKTEVILQEVDGFKNVIKYEDIDKLQKNLKKQITYNIEALIYRMQNKYKSDIFGFGDRIKKQNYEYWSKIENYNYAFSKLPVVVNVDVVITSTVGLSETIKVGNE